jgi:glycerol uptake facilitator-like aquaporin
VGVVLGRPRAPRHPLSRPRPGGDLLSATLARRLLAEALGTAFLLAAIVGSGIAAQRLSPGDTGLQLLENAIATGAALVAIILAFGHVSGAHLNPVVTVVERMLGRTSSRDAGWYCAAQVIGAVAGVAVANLMFDLPAFEISTTVREGGGVFVGEVVATLGLLLVIFGLARAGRSSVTPFAVGAFITAAYFFTSSTGFANPAVTIARTLTDTFTGIAPESAPTFVAMQLVGATLALAVLTALASKAATGPREVGARQEGAAP